MGRISVIDLARQALPTEPAGNSITRRALAAVMTARSMDAARSSRTLPGEGYRWKLPDPRQRGPPLRPPELAGGLGQEVVGRLRDVFHDFPEVPESMPFSSRAYEPGVAEKANQRRR